MSSKPQGVRFKTQETRRVRARLRDPTIKAWKKLHPFLVLELKTGPELPLLPS